MTPQEEARWLLIKSGSLLSAARGVTQEALRSVEAATYEGSTLKPEQVMQARQAFKILNDLTADVIGEVEKIGAS